MQREPMERDNLEKFDDLDYNVYTGQKWDELGRSHHRDIVVHWPDGHTTKGSFPINNEARYGTGQKKRASRFSGQEGL